MRLSTILIFATTVATSYAFSIGAVIADVDKDGSPPAPRPTPRPGAGSSPSGPAGPRPANPGPHRGLVRLSSEFSYFCF
jgi:hypothetical protein